MLTLTEIMTISECYPDREHFARAVIAAYEAKLREQEPVAIVDEAGVIIVCSYSYKPGDKLFKHPAPIPEGYVLVPIEPTEAMLCAGGDYLDGDSFFYAKKVWTAMLAARSGE